MIGLVTRSGRDEERSDGEDDDEQSGDDELRVCGAERVVMERVRRCCSKTPMAKRTAATERPMLPSQGVRARDGKETFDERDGDTDAPEGVDVEHEEGPPGTDAESGDPGVGEKVHVHAEDVGIEERLRGEGLLSDCVGDAEEKDGGPAAAGAASEFADQNRAATVHGREDDDQREPGGWKIAEQEFGDEGCDEEEGDGGKNGTIRVRHGRLSLRDEIWEREKCTPEKQPSAFSRQPSAVRTHRSWDYGRA